MSDKCSIFTFLEEYQKHSCLWLKSSQDYKNRNKRDAAEKELLEVSGLDSIKALRAKIRSVRGTYNQERGKVKSSLRTGSGVTDVYRPKLAWYDLADSFLRKNEAENESESNLVSVIQFICIYLPYNQRYVNIVTILVNHFILPRDSSFTNKIRC